ncbi:hypothetical protein LCGC14_1728700, partial [marine sediment metagenome]
MLVSEKGALGQINDVLRHECSECETEMSYRFCMFCSSGLIGVSTSRLTGTIPDSIVCMGKDRGHYCKACYDYLKNKKCPKCKSDHLTAWGIDKKDKIKAVVYECLDCKHKWEKS